MDYKTSIERVLYNEEFNFNECGIPNSYIVIRAENESPECVLNSFERLYAQACDSYMQKLYEDYPESEYEYELIPDGGIESERIENSEIMIELSRIPLVVYGRNIPSFYDFDEYIISELESTLINQYYLSLTYELLLVWWQDIGSEVETYKTIASNIETCSYEKIYAYLEEFLGMNQMKELEETSDYEEECDDEDEKEFLSKVRDIAEKVPFETLRDLFRIHSESWSEYNTDEIYDDYEHLISELVFDGFPDSMSYDTFKVYFDTDISEEEYLLTLKYIRIGNMV